jgi:hypothetical protein
MPQSVLQVALGSPYERTVHRLYHFQVAVSGMIEVW